MKPLFYPFSLPYLRYSFDSLDPFMSETTLRTHYQCNHQDYVDTANRLMQKKTDLQMLPLTHLMRITQGPLFNALAQHWNHSFYWLNLQPASPYAPRPTGTLANMIARQFGSMDQFVEEFTRKGKKQFGSGWLWLTIDRYGQLRLETTPNAGNPLLQQRTPLLAQDLWEHAYYIDYGCKRGNYLHSFFHIVNWHEVGRRLDAFLAS